MKHPLKRRLVLEAASMLVVCALHGAITPVPSEADIEAARPGVEELTQGDFIAMRSGAKTQAETAAAHNVASQPAGHCT